ncbi:MAG: QueT transporter family protein [Candidatus Bathyarchaeia archaeon]
MKFDSKDLALTVVFGALYAAGVIFLAPISFGIYQVRVADALLPLSVIFGIPVALGTGFGCLVANVYGGLGIIDIIGGTVANFVACVLAWLVGGESVARRLTACLVETVTITIIVGGYLALIFNVPVEVGLFGIFLGSIVAIDILGFTILEALHRSGIGKRYMKRSGELRLT